MMSKVDVRARRRRAASGASNSELEKMIMIKSDHFIAENDKNLFDYIYIYFSGFLNIFRRKNAANIISSSCI